MKTFNKVKVTGAQMHIPKGYDKEIIKDWICDDDIIINITENPGNLCIFFKFAQEDNSYRMIRFFNSTGPKKVTYASVDFDSSKVDPIEKLAELLAEQHNY